MSSKPNILVVGAGYVGLATAVHLAAKRFPVTVVEKNRIIVDGLNKGQLHFRENDLARALRETVRSSRLRTILPSKIAYEKADLIFIAIDSVNRGDWKMRLGAFERMANWIGGCNRRTVATVVLKSTNVVGFADQFRQLLESTPHGEKVRLVVNPEFLREGCAYQDTVRPWRIILGSKEKRDATRLLKIYNKVYSQSIPIVHTDIRSAELIKLASNVYLAHRLAFIHEITDFARIEQLDLSSIQRGIGLDERIGLDYFTPGLGFGGSCLPKDCRLINSAESETNFTFETAQTAMNINDRLLEHLVENLKNRLRPLKRKKIAILGAAFKPEVDDTRGSRAVKLAIRLRRSGARVSLYEPLLPNAEKVFEGNMPLVHDLDEALRGASALVIGTAHKQFRRLKPVHCASLMKKRLVVDYFGILNRRSWEKAGFEFV
ncbi:MAG: nucleotide sugar dehydrogenase [candidate division Zixibacteria bacterium]|nr:nucleotide sugar dehydrogenase [candidate division Zixibacteria bacterium]